MRLTAADKQLFIERDLYYELRCLLGAATVWQIFITEDRGFDVVIAMDAAFVHARCLFNFFTSETSSTDISITELGPAGPYASALYNQWKEPLHRHVLHISKGRASPTNVQVGGHLNEQVVAFANEILSLWERLESDPAAKDYAQVLVTARQTATQDAANDAATRGPILFI